jgi:hypothetical protein
MEFDPAPLRLAELTHDTVLAHLARDPRLLLPVGGFGGEDSLPIGWRSLLVSRMADDCSAALGWLRAPTIAFGTTDARGRRAPWSARPRTLQRFVNDLLMSAEALGVAEVLVLTARASEAQLDALATVHARRALIRVIDILPAGALGISAAQDAQALGAIIERLALPLTVPSVGDAPAYGVLRQRVLSALHAHRSATSLHRRAS